MSETTPERPRVIELVVSRETSEPEREPHDDTPIARAARTAVEVMSGRAGELPRPPRTRVLTVANQK
ncbi:MAG TPA: chromosome partitioning protein, partial [Actinomycetes bacterium]